MDSVNLNNTYGKFSSRAFGRLNGLKTSELNATKPVENFSSPKIQTVDPSKHGSIAQLINDHYWRELKKDTKKVLYGRKLEEFLKKTFSVSEFAQLPKSAQNLIKLNKGLSAADIIRLVEYWDESHEIVFKEYTMEKAKFKAIFNSPGELDDVQMEIGTNNYVSLSEEFDIRKKIEDVFSKAFEKLLFVKKRKKERQCTKIELDD